MMDKQLFDELTQSMDEMTRIVNGEATPSREFYVDALEVRRIRQATKLSQPKFAQLMQIPVGTLQNWEQGRREPTGPARALLRAIKHDPEHVLRAIR